MHYTLLGFSQEGSVRSYSFQRVTVDAPRVPFVVTVDLSLARRWNVPMQDLPQVCARVLQAVSDEAPAGRLSVTESDLNAASARNAAAAAEIAAAQSARSRRASRAAASRAADAAAPVESATRA